MSDLHFLKWERDEYGRPVGVYERSDGYVQRVLYLHRPEYLEYCEKVARAETKLLQAETEKNKARLDYEMSRAMLHEARKAIGGPKPVKSRGLPPRVLDDVEYRREEDDDERF